MNDTAGISPEVQQQREEWLNGIIRLADKHKLTANQAGEQVGKFVIGMSEEHFGKFYELPSYRKIHLLDLWLERNPLITPNTVAARQAPHPELPVGVDPEKESEKTAD